MLVVSSPVRLANAYHHRRYLSSFTVKFPRVLRLRSIPDPCRRGAVQVQRLLCPFGLLGLVYVGARRERSRLAGVRPVRRRGRHGVMHHRQDVGKRICCELYTSTNWAENKTHSRMTRSFSASSVLAAVACVAAQNPPFPVLPDQVRKSGSPCLTIRASP